MTSPVPAWLKGSGEMRARISALDWAGTPIGAFAVWPEELRTSVVLALGMDAPCCIFWGREAIQIYNDAYALVMKRKHPGFLGRGLLEAWPERDAELREVIATVFQGQTISEAEQPWELDREGELKTYTFSISMSPILGVQGDVLGIFHVAQEKTNEVLTRRLQRAKELTSTFESMPDAVYVGNLNGITDCNSEAIRMLGATGIEDLRTNIGDIGRRFAVRSISSGQLIPPEELSFVRALRTGQTVVEDVMATRGDTGENVYIRGASAPIFDNGEIIGAVAINTDVTDRYRAQIALQESQEQLRLALASASQGTWFFDPKDGLLRGDEQMTSICGSLESVGPISYWLNLVHLEDRDRVASALEVTLSGGSDYDAEYRVVREGEIRWVRSRGRLLRGSRNSFRMFAVVEDISNRKMTESALRHSERMAEIGRLTSSIAHEINNPLEAVTNLLYIVRSGQLSKDQDGYLATAEAELQRVTAIANQTLRFYKQSSIPTATTCEDLFESVLSIHKARSERHHVRIQRGNKCKSPVVCFEGEIRQVLSNLIGNSIDAMANKGGSLHVKSREGTCKRTGRKGHFLMVADTGMGMSPETVAHLFEPFYTTKGLEGNGLGLWISQEILARHTGSIRVRSQEGTGTVFSLFLPVVAVTR